MKRTENHKTAILVNLTANNGRAEKRWRKIEHSVLSNFEKPPIVVCYTTPFNIEKYLVHLIDDERVDSVISAGGDGSLNYVLNRLMHLENVRTEEFFLGGIGLGSSNDFVKPKRNFIQNIPVRMDIENAVLSDIGMVEFNSKEGYPKTKFFIANSSLGVTAQANYLFNQGDWVINFLKNKSTDLAIIYTALKTIFSFKNILVRLTSEEIDQEMILSNLAVLKNPHVSGDFQYDQNIKSNDGKLGLNICENMDKFELVKTLIDLNKGKFSGKPKRHSSFVEKLEVKPPGFVALEMDGEVELGKDFTFSVASKRIKLMN